MHQVAAGFLVQMPREASNGQRNLPRHSQIQNITGSQSCLCTRSPSAVSAQCQRCQRPLASLATSAPAAFRVARTRRGGCTSPARRTIWWSWTASGWSWMCRAGSH